MNRRRRTAHLQFHDSAPALGRDAEDRVWAEVQRRIDLGPVGRPVLQPAPSRSTVMAVVAAACTVLLVTGLVLGRPGGGGDRAVAGRPPPSFATLAAAADAAPVVALDEVRPVLHVVQVLRIGGSGLLVDQLIAGDGSGEARSGAEGGPLGERAIKEAEMLTIGGLVPARVGSLPAHEDALEAVLDSVPGATPAEDWLLAAPIAELLAVPLLLPRVRAAMVRLLERIGGRVGEATVDADGRPGVAVSVVGPDGSRVTITLDPATGVALDREVDSPSAPPSLAIFRLAEAVPG